MGGGERGGSHDECFEETMCLSHRFSGVYTYVRVNTCVRMGVIVCVCVCVCVCMFVNSSRFVIYI